jgi:hypothetical protein
MRVLAMVFGNRGIDLDSWKRQIYVGRFFHLYLSEDFLPQISLILVVSFRWIPSYNERGIWCRLGQFHVTQKVSIVAVRNNAFHQGRIEIE